MYHMTPKEIVKELNNYIIGQEKAKKCVAIALRNRWRRLQITDENLKNEITPKNILMIGPTGVGKTEISKRLAKLSNAPFIKVEATKFTEVGYVGKEVDSIIRDLTDASVKMMKLEYIKKNRIKAEYLAEERILDVLIPLTKGNNNFSENEKNNDSLISNNIRNNFRKMLKEKKLDNKEIEINLSTPVGIEIMAPPGMEEMTNQLQSIFKNISNNKLKKRKIKIKEAIKLLIEEESSKLINFDEIKEQAIEKVEQNGIVFIDEIDKICKRNEISNSDISREGVQRDLLPLIEGCSVSTKHGIVKTDYILFIASGAFQTSSPSDLLPELQGRLPIKIELNSLSIEDFEKILVEPNNSLITQYINLMSSEGVNISFTNNAIKSISEAAWKINEHTENIGARRLYTILEHIMEDILYNITEKSLNNSNKYISINSKYVKDHIKTLIFNKDYNKYML